MKQIINVTDIISYLYCQRKLYLKRVKKIREPVTEQMVKGMLKHKVFDIFNKNEIILVSSITEQKTKSEIQDLYKSLIQKIFQETFSNNYSLATSFSINPISMMKSIIRISAKDIELRAEAVYETMKQGFLGKELWRNLKPKFLTEFEILSEELGLKGRIDRIKFDESIIPYEIKTREEIYESDKLQLAAYALLLESEFNKPINIGVVEVESKQEEIQITEELKSKVLEIAEKIRTMEKGEFPSNFKKCENCRLKEECFQE